MSQPENIDGVRRATLDRIERTEKNYKLAFFSAAILEASFLGGFLLLADFSNRLHLLLLLASVATYSILALGLVVLGAHVSQNTLRILKAIELLGESRKRAERES
jgi:hypothetical protein